ncbi:MAG: hypothetical protein [Arizlama microvirus]|nr:MAG: hypothetical protein [Arizlama microvirus]
MSKKTSRSADINTNANDVQSLLRLPVLQPIPIAPPIAFADERTYSPLRWPVPLAPGGRPARLRTPPAGPFRRAGVRFEGAARVNICVKRKQRREILFARNKTGKGSKTRFRKRNSYTGVKCK